MWKSLVIGFISLPLSALAFVIGWAAGTVKVGVIACACVLALGWAAAAIMLFTIRSLSLIDVFLPIPAAVVWSLLLTAVNVGEAFTVPTCIGSAILLSISLWMVRQGKFPRSWAIIPITVFIYEMLPVNIPGPFDDYFSFTGDAAVLLLQGAMYTFRKESLPVGAGDSNRRLNP